MDTNVTHFVLNLLISQYAVCVKDILMVTIEINLCSL